MDLKQYIAESSRSYHYRIKTVVPIGNDEMDKIESSLTKYKIIDVTSPKKTLLQTAPLDFSNVTNAEVYLIDVTTGLPVSSYVMQQELRNALNCPEKYIVVRGSNEPIEVESERLNAEREMDDEARKKGMRRAAMLGTDSQYDESEQTEDGENFFGNDYNTKLLDYLHQIQQSRAPEKKEPAFPLLKWLDMPKETTEPKQVAGDFNAKIGGVKPASTRTAAKAADPGDAVKRRSNQGNFDNDTMTYSRKYGDANSTKTLSRTVSNIRKEQK